MLYAFIFVPLATPVALFAIAKLFRPRATNLELHKFYVEQEIMPTETKEQEIMPTETKERYKDLARYFLEKENRKKIRTPSRKKITKSHQS